METLIGGSQGSQPGANGWIKEGDTSSFVEDVLEASVQVPIIVDFWATWCQPCKTLGPLLEKLVKEAKGSVRLVKVNVDKNQELAAQMRIQSIPAVYAFKNGRPVDGFVGAVTESQVKAFIQRLVGAAVDSKPGIEEALAEAKALLVAGDAATAIQLFQEILGEDPENAAALGGAARCLLQLGQADEAKHLLDSLPAELAKHAEITAARTALELAEQAGQAGPAAELRRAVAVNPDDHQARFDLAMAYFAGGEREAAVDELLELYRRNKGWNEEAARKQLVKLFEAFGPTDPLTISARKRLSSLMFA